MKFDLKKIPVSKERKKLILLLFWGIYVICDYIGRGLMNLGGNGSFFYDRNLFAFTMYSTQLLTIFVINAFIAPNILKKITWKRVVVSLILSYSIFIFFRYLLEQILTDILFGKINYYKDTSISFYIYDNLHFGSFIVFFTLFIGICIDLINAQQESNAMQQEKKDAEIKFLKAQINPHFLFNTLNNIYSLVSTNSGQSLKAIENLSAIMRYTTYEIEKEQIQIEKELEYIQQYLALEQMRFGEKFYVQTEFDIDDPKALIIPYVLFPLVENALKHGVVKEENNPINISVKTSKEYLQICVTNKVNYHQKDHQKGIGLTNLKQRLNFYFKNQYELIIKNENEIFNIYIKLPINGQY